MTTKKNIDPTLLEALQRLVEPLILYHRHEALGIENVPKKGPVLLVVNHSLATYDISLLLYKVFHERNRLVRPLMDKWFFVVPGIKDLMLKLGATEGNPKAAESLLKKGEMLCVAPGGMKEALRSSDHKYQVNWGSRKGFAKLAIKTQTPVVLAACPAADDIFSVYKSGLTDWFYKNFKIPFVPFRGFGLSIIPRPVKLIHYIGAPIAPPKVDPKDIEKETEIYKRKVDEFHALLTQEMQKLLLQA